MPSHRSPVRAIAVTAILAAVYGAAPAEACYRHTFETCAEAPAATSPSPQPADTAAPDPATVATAAQSLSTGRFVDVASNEARRGSGGWTTEIKTAR